jgi:hypothetical protein
VGSYNLTKPTLKHNSYRRKTPSATVIYQLHKTRVPPPTLYTLPGRISSRKSSCAQSVFRSKSSRFPKVQKDAPFCWTYNVKVDLVHPTAPRTSSLRYTDPRLNKAETTADDMSALLADLTRPEEVRHSRTRPVMQRPRNGIAIAKQPKSMSTLPKETTLPGPGTYNLGKYSSFVTKDTPANFNTLCNLKECSN